jgi:hypothetical protein
VFVSYYGGDVMGDKTKKTPYEELTAEQVAKLEEAAAPLWRAMEEHGWVDGYGGAEFTRVFPEALNFIHASSNLGPYGSVAVTVNPGWGEPPPDSTVAAVGRDGSIVVIAETRHIDLPGSAR